MSSKQKEEHFFKKKNSFEMNQTELYVFSTVGDVDY